MSQPPYGELLENARTRARLSRREAARRSGISDNWWRAVVSGSQNNGAPAHGSPETVAAMARAVGVNPDQLEQAGNPDAAEVLREIESSEPPSRENRMRLVPDSQDDDDEMTAMVAVVTRTIMGQSHKPLGQRERELAAALAHLPGAARGEQRALPAVFTSR